MEPETKEDKIVTQTKKNRGKTILIAALGTLILTIGLAIGILLVRQNQQIRERAATPTGTVKVFLSPETKTVQVGQTFSVNILLDTSDRYISALTLDLSFPYSGDTPPLAVNDTGIQINSNLVVNGNWNFPIKIVNSENQLFQIRIGGLNSLSQGYKTTGEETVATINFKAQATGSVTLSFNPTTTKATDKSTGEDILLIPSSAGYYTVQSSEATTTPTITSTPTPTPISIPVTTSTPSPIPAPESGISLPTVIGIGGSILLLLGAVILAL